MRGSRKTARKLRQGPSGAPVAEGHPGHRREPRRTRNTRNTQKHRSPPLVATRDRSALPTAKAHSSPPRLGRLPQGKGHRGVRAPRAAQGHTLLIVQRIIKFQIQQFQIRKSPLLGAVPSPVRLSEHHVRTLRVSIPSAGGSAFTKTSISSKWIPLSFNPLFWGQCLHHGSWILEK